jgi:hypothetical protein
VHRERKPNQDKIKALHLYHVVYFVLHRAITTALKSLFMMELKSNIHTPVCPPPNDIKTNVRINSIKIPQVVASNKS